MAVFKCKMCGEPLDLFKAVNGICRCDLCNTTQTISRLSSEKIEDLYGRASHFRRLNEFDLALSLYQQIITEDPDDPEAYWGVVLCRYGIEYVKDAGSGLRIPTVNRTQLVSVFFDEEYKIALELANDEQRAIYIKEATAIDEIQKGILEISTKEEPFDVFICYKETAPDGRRTEDSVLANQLYNELTRDGLKVFFSRITLESKLGNQYEPYIFSALQSAKAMVVFGTQAEYFNAVWVKNEWSRFLGLIKAGKRKFIIPAYNDANDLPDEFKSVQGQDLTKIGAILDLAHGVEKLVGKKKPEPSITAPTPSATVIQPVTGGGVNVASLIERAYDSLKFKDFAEALSISEKIKDADYKNANAYVIALLAELKLTSLDGFDIYDGKKLDNMLNYQKAVSYADADLVDRLKRACTQVNANVKRRLEEEVRKAYEDKMYAKGDKYELVKGTVRFPRTMTRIDSEMFMGNESVTKVIIHGGIKEIGDSAFMDCPYLAAVEFAEGVEIIGESSFGGCSIKKIELPSTVKVIDDNAFACNCFSSINIPDSVERIGEYAFQGCNYLSSVVLGCGVKVIGGRAFQDCVALSSINLPEGLESIGEYAFNKVKITDLVVPSSVKSIGEYAFFECESLLSVDLGNGIEEIGTCSFSKCHNLKSLNLGTSIKKIGSSAFWQCYALTSVYIPSSVTILDNAAFQYCKSLVDVKFDENIQIKTIFNAAFEGCYSLKSIDLPSTVIIIRERAFYNCESLENVKLPSGLTHIDHLAFFGCKSLLSLYLPEGITVGNRAFSGCFALTLYCEDKKPFFASSPKNWFKEWNYNTTKNIIWNCKNKK